MCDKCVERFDHHCPWLNNCVGVRNHNYYLGYTVAQLLLLMTTFVICTISFTTTSNNIIASIILAISGLFIIPVTYLILVHVNNFCSGKTTHERLTRYPPDTSLEEKVMNSGIAFDNRLFASCSSFEYNSLLERQDLLLVREMSKNEHLN